MNNYIKYMIQKNINCNNWIKITFNNTTRFIQKLTQYPIRLFKV